VEPGPQHGIADPRRLSDFIRGRATQIIDAWERAVRDLRPARGLSRPVLLDHIPDFLQELAEFIGEVRQGHEVPLPEQFPRIHAIERLDLGYDLGDVVEEYAVLRLCIVEMVVREGSPSIRSAQMPRLHQAIDQAIAASVTGYSQARERTLQALDRISTAALGVHGLEDFLQRLLEVLLETTATVDTVSVLLREGDELRIKAAAGVGTEIMGEPRRRIGEGFIGIVAATRSPASVRDASTDPLVLVESYKRHQIHALHGVPLMLGDDLIGVAVVGSCSTFEFSSEDLLLFRTMATRAAALIAQARLHAQLQEHTTLYETMLKAQSDLGEAFFMLERDRVLYANDASYALIGYTREELPRIDSLYPFIAPGDQAMVRDRIVRRQRGEEVSDHLEAEIIDRDGKHARLEVAVKPLGEDRVVVIGRDITARKQAEEAAGRNEEALRSAVAVRDEMMGVLSHDLRQPLNVISVTAETLLREPALSSYGRFFTRLARNAQRINRMVRDLLDYARARQGTSMPVMREPFDLRALAEQAIDAMETIHPGQPLQLSTSGETTASVDPERFLQALSNLLGNAFEYGEKNQPIDVRLTGDPEAVTVEVHNRGPPIPADLLPFVFEPFRRGSEGPAHPSGLGLGLYIVRQIATAHGGTVLVRSSEEEGTTFSLRFPRT
jgi:PAS domain S-box-containing protein